MIKGDRIKLVKSMGMFTDIGEICEVVDVSEGGVISFRFGGYHLGCMSYDEFEKYFELIPNIVVPKREWSDWNEHTQYYTQPNGVGKSFNMEYRDNGKRVQVKCNGLRAMSTCHKEDDFDITKGLILATRRLIVKVLEHENNIYAKSM